MLTQLDPAFIAIAVLMWPVTRSTVFLSALYVSVYSRDEKRRAAAERVLRIVCGGRL